MNGADALILLEAYCVALQSLDAGGLAACYDTAAVIVERDATVVMSNPKAVMAEMVARVERYRHVGLKAARLGGAEFSAAGDHAHEARVAWSLDVAQGSAEFETRYWLVDRGEGPRIAAVLAGGR